MPRICVLDARKYIPSIAAKWQIDPEPGILVLDQLSRVAVLELIVLGFLWWGYNWARWLFIAYQVWEIWICYDHFVRRPFSFIAGVGPLVVIVIPACIVAYLCMPHVRGRFSSRGSTKR